MRPRIIRFTAVALACLAVAVACGSPGATTPSPTVAAPSPTMMASPSAAITSSTKAADLRVALNTQLEEHVYLAGFAVAEALLGNTPGFEGGAAALDMNSVELVEVDRHRVRRRCGEAVPRAVAGAHRHVRRLYAGRGHQGPGRQGQGHDGP